MDEFTNIVNKYVFYKDTKWFGRFNKSKNERLTQYQVMRFISNLYQSIYNKELSVKNIKLVMRNLMDANIELLINEAKNDLK